MEITLTLEQLSYIINFVLVIIIGVPLIWTLTQIIVPLIVVNLMGKYKPIMDSLLCSSNKFELYKDGLLQTNSESTSEISYIFKTSKIGWYKVYYVVLQNYQGNLRTIPILQFRKEFLVIEKLFDDAPKAKPFINIFDYNLKWYNNTYYNKRYYENNFYENND